MRIVYWTIFVIAMLVAMLTMSAPSPSTSAVSATAMDQWLSSGNIVALIVGAVGGVATAFLVSRRVRLRPKETGTQYNRRVIVFGLWTSILVGALVFLYLASSAYRAAGWQSAPADRVSHVLAVLRFWGVVCSALAISMLVFGLISRARPWNGRRALI